MTRLAVDPHEPPALLHDAVDRGQPQAGPFADILGGEERLEDMAQRRPINPAAGVADHEHGVGTRCQ